MKSYGHSGESSKLKHLQLWSLSSSLFWLFMPVSTWFPQTACFQEEKRQHGRNCGKDGGVWRSSREKQNYEIALCWERRERWRDGEGGVLVLSGWRGVQDGIAHRNMSLWVHTHYTLPPHMLVFLQPRIHTHAHTFPVLPLSWTHNLVPRWFMWVHVSMFLHTFPFCMFWPHPAYSTGFIQSHLDGTNGIKSILPLISHTTVRIAGAFSELPPVYFINIKLPTEGNIQLYGSISLNLCVCVCVCVCVCPIASSKIHQHMDTQPKQITNYSPD